MTARDDKAHRYISALDTARVNGNWSEFPELIRKVTKHAGQRKVLITTATAEHAVATHILSTKGRPASGSSDTRPLTETIHDLEAVLKAGGSGPDELIQGHTCLLWAKWADGSRSEDPVLAADKTNLNKASTSADSKWTKICLVKAAYIRATIYAQNKEIAKSRTVSGELSPWLSSNRDEIKTTPQFQYWSTQLLGLAATSSEQQSTADTSSLAIFRQWSGFAAKSADEAPSTYGNPKSPIPRHSIWKRYYNLLSQVMARSIQDTDHSRVSIAEEFRLVETAYESELLKSSAFPKATESNFVMEEWVEQVVRNWQTLCGPKWSESDLGTGGRNAIGRNVLDILYRAAMKTFHSTLILRRLYQVHKSLAEFDLAYHALDTYMEYIDRGRARAAKSHQPVEGQDDDELVARTIADGIEGLCSFGRQAEAERAHELCIKLESLLKELGGGLPDQGHPQPSRQLNGDLRHTHEVSKLTLGIAHRALGIGKAHWARWTPFNETRTSLQSAALSHLKFAVSQDLAADEQIRTLYALTLLLADSREADQAIGYAKMALSISVSSPSSDTTYARQRQLLPMWHLMALLLTSRQDFVTATQSCAAAFDQFPSSDILFGSGPNRKSRTEMVERSEGLVHDMECHELERLLEVQLSELALTELKEGPDHAVNSSNDLLSLYSRLFRHLGVSGESLSVKSNDPSQQNGLAHKGSRANFFSRRKASASVMSETNTSQTQASQTNDQGRPDTQATLAPTITITGEDGKQSPSKSRKSRRSQERSARLSTSKERVSRLVSKAEPHLPHHHKGAKSSQTGSQPSSQRQSLDTAEDKSDIPGTTRPPLGTIHSGLEMPARNLASNHADSRQAKQDLDSVSHNLSHDSLPPPARHEKQPPEQDVRLPGVHPATTSTCPPPRFPQTSSQKYALTILVKIWLVIARLYRRANMFEDSREATGEAAKAATKIEKLISTVESSARAFADPGWGGGGKSSDEVWADIYCEQAELLLSTARVVEDVGGQVDTEDIREAVDRFEQCLMYYPNHPGGIIGLSNMLLDYYERKIELAQKVDDGRVIKSAINTANNEHRRTGNWANDTTLSYGMMTQPTPAVRVANGSTTQAPSSAPNGLFESSTSIPAIRVNEFSTPDWSGNAAARSPSTGANNALLQTPAQTQTPAPSDSAQIQVQRVLDERDELRKTPENLNRLAARDRAYGLLATLTKLGSGWDNSEAWFALARAHELGGELDKAKEILWWCVRLEDTRPIRHWRNIGSGGYVLI